MSKYIWLIDAGHGGVDSKGVYHCLAGGKMYDHGEFTIYEGDVNRKIADKLWRKLLNGCIDFDLVYHDIEDWSLTKRVQLCNTAYRKNNNCILLSIHNNAGKGKGTEIFTSVGKTKSDLLCLDKLKKLYLEGFNYRWPFRDGGSEVDKEADFTILKSTLCPAVLTESLFFDEIEQARYLLSDEGQERIAQILFDWIKHVEQAQPI